MKCLKNAFLTICYCSFLATCCPATAAWDPSSCISKENLSASGLLKDQEYLYLKGQVLAYLKNSWCSSEKTNLIMDLIVLTQPEVCVEIGTFTGSSFVPILATQAFLNKGIAYAIDPWSNLEAIKGMPANDQHYLWWLTVDMQEAYRMFRRTLDDWNFYIGYAIFPFSSKSSFVYFDRIDFLHIDGNISEEGSLEDVLLYLPKVAPGGYILLSNVFITVGGEFSKMQALWILQEQCETIAEIEGSNAILFQKPF